jgi:hypothetical protein
MENLLSKQLLNEIKNKFVGDHSDVALSDLKSKRLLRAKGTSEVSVFLSHKHEETEILEDTVVLLSKLGVAVYIDWLDNEMPENTSGETARKIKEKITTLDKFIFLATEGAINSKWCNWELGFGDAKKFHQNMAIMPITNFRDNKWSGIEYLQIYPTITQSHHNSSQFYVEYLGGRVNLEDWLIR